MKKIGIIGAGYTGLSAAYKLAKAGFDVTILEKGQYPGGLAGGFKMEGSNLEIAYHHIFKTDKDIIALAKEIGADINLKWHSSSVALYYDNKLYPFMSALDLLRFSPLSFFNRIRAGITVLYLQKIRRYKQFIKIPAYNWMLRNAGKSVTRVIWEPLLKGKFDQFYNKVSMAWLWARIHIRANSREKGDTGEKLGYFDGGFDVFTKKLVSEIEKLGGKLVFGVKVEEIDKENNSKVIKIVTDKEQFKFDNVIFTAPGRVLSDLIKNSAQVTADYINKLNSIDYLGAILYVFSSSQEISKYYWHNINDLNSPFLVFINHTRLIDKKNYNNMYVYYVGAYLPHSHRYFEMNQDKITSEWEGYLNKIFPEFNPKAINQRNLFKLKYAQHIVDLDYLSKIPDYKTPMDGLFLVNFSQIFPEDRGTNFAVREGLKIAELVINKNNDKK